MKRDMDLIRYILLSIEDKYIDSSLQNLQIEGFDMKTVAYHCKILFQENLISYYKPIEADNGLYGFFVGSLTWEGHDFLDKIRDNSIWNKTKAVITDKGLPMIVDTIKQISSTIIKEATSAVIKGMI